MRIGFVVKGPPGLPEVAPNALLKEALRYCPQLTGTRVDPQARRLHHVAGRAQREVVQPMEVQGDGRAVTTIEGLDAPLHHMQAAFSDCHRPAISAS